jgi:hypothetical protein
MMNVSNARARAADEVLLYCALLAWCLSLLLPAFALESASSTVVGLHVLLVGTAFGWMVNGWAVYANPLFLFAAYRLYRGKAPGKTVLAMLLLAATLPLFRGSLEQMGERTVPVSSWGWGAFVWLCALVLLAGAAAARRKLIAWRGALALGLGMLLAGMAMAALHQRQWRAANETDRLALLPSGMMYSTSPFCPLALAWPAPSDANGGEALVIDLDPRWQRAGALPLPLEIPGGFNAAHADGSAWTSYAGWYGGMMVRQAAQAGTLVLKLEAAGAGARMRLLKGVPQRVLYEQPLLDIGRGHGLCPVSERLPNGGLRRSYGEALLRAMGQDNPVSLGTPLAHAEVARQRCDIGAVDIDGIDGLRSLDGREVILPARMNSLSGFCSEHYIALAAAGAPGGAARLPATVHVLDRKTLKPLAMFDGERSCPPQVCAPGQEVILRAIRLDGGSAVVETSRGDYVGSLSDHP